MSKTIEVKILGKNFVFNIPEDITREEFFEIIHYVEDKLASIKSETIDLDSFKLGLLTSINIAEELFSLKRENENLKVILNKIDTIISPLMEEVPFTSSQGSPFSRVDGPRSRNTHLAVGAGGGRVSKRFSS